jgi:hypothetical protein
MKIKYEEWVAYYNNIWLISGNKKIIVIIKRWDKIKDTPVFSGNL